MTRNVRCTTNDALHKVGFDHFALPDDPMAEARAFAGRFRHASTDAIGIAKNILNNSFNNDLKTLLELEASGQGIASTSDYHTEAVRRFADKAPALFDWERFEKEAGND